MYSPPAIMDPEFAAAPARLPPKKTPSRVKLLLPAVVGAAIIALAIIVIVLVAKHRTPVGAKAYTLDTDLSGGKIKPGADPASMRFYVRADDPTHGHVKYDSWDDLVTVQAGKTVISAGSVSNGPRNMVRLVSKKKYNSGLFVISADHMPEGLGVWPSFWLTAYEPDGTKWACNGEIDIIEGVNSVGASSSHNTSTLHTNDKKGVACRQNGVPGISQEGNCSSPGRSSDSDCGCDKRSACPYAGCGVTLDSATSFGKGFNDAGGGVYACELTPEGVITVWFFPRGQTPADLDANDPDPSKWPATNRTAFKPCPGQFADLQMVLNTTLCGTWAGDKYPGGRAKCEHDIEGADLSKAYWSIDYIKVFVRNDVYPGDVSLEPTPWRDSTSTHGSGGGAKKCPPSVPATESGVDMYAGGCCSRCADGLNPYLIQLSNSKDYKYYCFANDDQATTNGNIIKARGEPKDCGGSPGSPGSGSSGGCKTAAGADMYHTGTCCLCADGLNPYLMKTLIPNSNPPRYTGSYHCYGSDAEATKTGLTIISKSAPAKCGSEGFRARNYVHQSMEDFMGGFGDFGGY